MESKDSHIDQFFEKQLAQIEAQPDQKAKEAIFKYLEHTEHPIDFALEKTLSDYNEAPTSLSVLENLGSDLPVIDLALHRHLKTYEEAPDKVFSLEPKKKKRRALWLILIILFVSVVSYSVLLNKSTSSAKQKVLVKHDNQNQFNKQETNNTEKPRALENINSQIESSNNKVRHTLNRKTSGISNKAAELESKEEFETDGLGNFLEAKRMAPYVISLPIDEIALVALKQKSNSLLYKTAPFSFLFQAGVNREVGQSSALLSNNQHKDAQALFSESTGKYRAGKSYSLIFDYHFSKKINIGVGVIYSNSSNVSSVDYFYTDVPVYDTTGTLRGYLKRPGSKSNHTEAEVKNESRSLFIPINLQYQILQFRKLGIWIGAGTQFALQRQITGQFFDFKKEQMVENSEKFSRGLLPQMQIGFRYPLTDKWQLSTKFQIARQTLTFNIQDAIFKRVEILPTLNFGLVYTPHIRIK